MGRKHTEIINRDISWLGFNARVLQEAEDASVPLLERLRFLGIFSNNRDEFFRVRIATIRRMLKWGKNGKQILKADPSKLLDKIQGIVMDQQKKFDTLFNVILKKLEAENVFLVNEKQLNPLQQNFVSEYFEQKVFPFLIPIMIESAPKFPYLKDKMMYLAVKITQKEKIGVKYKYSLIEVPTDVLSRFVIIPSSGDKKYIILLEDIIRFCLKRIYSVFDFNTIEAYTIKMTRDSELDLDTDVSKSIVEKISKSVKQRKKGDPVRLVYDEKIPDDLLAFILKKIKLKQTEYLIPGGRYHNFKDFIKFPQFGKKELWYKRNPPLEHPALVGQKSIFSVLKKKDVLLAYPYHTFNHIIDLLREAAIDPKVSSIKITLYRASANSGIVNALINAIKNGKQVTAVVELQARFDEETNIYYANKLQEEGAEVIYGVPGLKVHSKLFLITRKEEGRTILYSHIGTGNFNENTARLYADHSLLTADKSITREVEKLFGFYRNNYKTGHYKHLIVSPFNTRKRFTQMIQQEIDFAKQKKTATIILKMNSLVDDEMITKLYEAGQAGVKIKLIIRGICSLIPGVKGLSENIEAISIVDRYLEHSRILIFGGGGKEKYFIASGDWMNRNLDFRSEVAVQINDLQLQAELKKYISIQLSDNVKARNHDKDNDNAYVEKKTKAIRAQDEIYKWVSEKAVLTPRILLQTGERVKQNLLNTGAVKVKP